MLPFDGFGFELGLDNPFRFSCIRNLMPEYVEPCLCLRVRYHDLLTIIDPIVNPFECMELNWSRLLRISRIQSCQANTLCRQQNFSSGFIFRCSKTKHDISIFFFGKKSKRRARNRKRNVDNNFYLDAARATTHFVCILLSYYVKQGTANSTEITKEYGHNHCRSKGTNSEQLRQVMERNGRIFTLRRVLLGDGV